MKTLKDSSGGETKSSPRLRHLAIGLVVTIVVAVVLTTFGHARIHASASGTVQSDSNILDNQAAPGVAFHTKVAARDDASRPNLPTKSSDSTVIVHGSLDGELRATDHARWRHWLQ